MVEPEPLAVATNSGERDGLVTVELEGGPVASISRMMLAQSLVHDSHKALGFSRFRLSTQGPAEVSFSLGNLAKIEGSPHKDQFAGRGFLGRARLASNRARARRLSGE